MKGYFNKMKGGTKSPPGVGLTEILWSWLGAVIGIGICGYLSHYYFEPRDLSLIIGSFGASAVLVYAAIKSPLAQPRNLVGGHIISGLVGVLCFQVFGGTLWIASALAVSLAIAGMPPLNGFASKWLIYATGILGSGVMWLLPLAALVAMFISLATLASFLKYLGGTFLGQRPPVEDVREVPASMLIPQACLALLCLALGLVPLVPLAGVYQAVSGLASAAGLPSLATLLGGGPGLELAGAGLAAGSWAPLVVGLGLAVVGWGCYVALQRAGGAATREVPVWTCGEVEERAAVRYVPGSFYRPFKDAFHGVYPTMHVRVPAFPVFLRRFFEADRWLYYPLARGADRTAHGVARVHVGLLQVYLLWIIVGAVAVFLLLLLVGGGS